MSETTVAMVGGTGNLGRMIASSLLDQPGVHLRVLVRVGSADKAEELRARGAQVVEGDLTAGSEAGLTALCEGASAVVSAVQGGPEVIVEGQRRLLAAAREAGVARFLPSDFSINIFGLAEGENINSDWRRAFAVAADAERGEVEVVHVFNGCFIDRPVLFGFLGAFDLERGQAHLWGEGEEPMDLTTYADTAAYTAAAATDTRPVPRELAVAGDVLDFHGVVRAYAETSGRSLEVQRHGTLDDLDQRIADLQGADPGDVFAYLPLMYWRGMLSGKGKSPSLSNQLYPGITPTTVAQYLQAQGV